MSDKVVEVPGVGNVAFPESMSDQDIGVQIRKLTGPSGMPGAPKPPSAWDRAVSAFGEYTSPLHPSGEPFEGLLSRAVQGIADIPRQSGEALHRFSQALTKGDLPGAAYHLAGVVPILGPMSQTVADDIDKGDLAGAVGHTAGILAMAGVAKPGAAADAVGDAASVAGAGARVVKNAATKTLAKTPEGIAGAGGAAVGGYLGRTALGGWEGTAAGAYAGREAGKALARKLRASVDAQKAAESDAVVAAQRKSGRTPAWDQQVAEAPPVPIDTQTQPAITEPPVLPSGRQPGGIDNGAARRAADQRGLNRKPAWYGIPDPAPSTPPPVSTPEPAVSVSQSAEPVAPVQAQPKTAAELSQALADELGKDAAPAPVAKPKVDYAGNARATKVDAFAKYFTAKGIPASQIEEVIPVDSFWPDATTAVSQETGGRFGAPSVASRRAIVAKMRETAPKPAESATPQTQGSPAAQAKQLAEAVWSDGKGLSGDQAAALTPEHWQMLGERLGIDVSPAVRAMAVRHIKIAEAMQPTAVQ